MRRRDASHGRRCFVGGLAAFSTMCLTGCRKQKPKEQAVGEYFWSGIGFGIEMSMELYGVSREKGEHLGAVCEDAIESLEKAFSLYRDDSELSRLNRDKWLKGPSADFVELMNLAVNLEQRSLGYYQPAVHGAWQWLSTQTDLAGIEARPEWRRRCAAMDLKFCQLDQDQIRLLNPLTELSMNAIGQGFLADRVAAEVRAAGVGSAMLHLGESLAIGSHPTGRPWRLAVAGSVGEDSDDDLATIDLVDSGLAVSATDQGRRLIDPVECVVRQHARTVAVVTREGAAVADAFATAFAVAPEAKWSALFEALEAGVACQVHIWENGQRRFQQMAYTI